MIHRILLFLFLAIFTTSTYGKNSKVVVITDYVRKGDSLVKREIPLKVEPPKDSGYLVSNFDIRKDDRGVSLVRFKIDTRYMKFDLYPESEVYVFGGKTPESAKLYAVSSVGGDVSFRVAGVDTSTRWFLAGTRGAFIPVEVKTNLYNKQK